MEYFTIKLGMPYLVPGFTAIFRINMSTPPIRVSKLIFCGAAADAGPFAIREDQVQRVVGSDRESIRPRVIPWHARAHQRPRVRPFSIGSKTLINQEPRILDAGTINQMERALAIANQAWMRRARGQRTHITPLIWLVGIGRHAMQERAMMSPDNGVNSPLQIFDDGGIAMIIGGLGNDAFANRPRQARSGYTGRRRPKTAGPRRGAGCGRGASPRPSAPAPIPRPPSR